MSEPGAAAPLWPVNIRHGVSHDWDLFAASPVWSLIKCKQDIPLFAEALGGYSELLEKRDVSFTHLRDVRKPRRLSASQTTELSCSFTSLCH